MNGLPKEYSFKPDVIPLNQVCRMTFESVQDDTLFDEMTSGNVRTVVAMAIETLEVAFHDVL